MLQDDRPSIAASRSAHRIVTQSGWFWLAAFSAMGLMALWAMQLKFGARQAQIERQFQARRQAAQRAPTPDQSGGDKAEVVDRYSTATDTMIGLHPLRILLWMLFGVALAGIAVRVIRARHTATT